MKISVHNAGPGSITEAEILVKNEISYTPLVSVVVPVFNVQNYLRRSISCILNQSVREIELICVDDGSTDDSLNILLEFAAVDKRVSVISQKNMYAGVARNAGIEMARGEYIMFLDADDTFSPQLIEKTYSLINRDQSDIVCYQFCDCDDKTNNVTKVGGIQRSPSAYGALSYCCSPKEISERIFFASSPVPWNKLFRLSFIRQENLRFQAVQNSNDIYFSYAAMACAKKISFLYEPLVFRIYNRTDSLRNTRDNNPLCFDEAYQLLGDTLREKGLFSLYEQSYINAYISTGVWTLANVKTTKDIVRAALHEHIYQKYGPRLQELDLPEQIRCYLGRIRHKEIVVSMTSNPDEIAVFHRTIESVFSLRFQADRVILNLSLADFPNGEEDIPEQILKYKSQGLEINLCHSTGRNLLLKPTLERYPDAIIVTLSAPIQCHKQWLYDLFSEYVRQDATDTLYSHKIARLVCTDIGEVKELNVNGIPGNKYIDKSIFNLPYIRYGTLFPTGALNYQVVDEVERDALNYEKEEALLFARALKRGYRAIAVTNARFVYSTDSTKKEPHDRSVSMELSKLLSTDQDLHNLYHQNKNDNEQQLTSLIQDDMLARLLTYRIDVAHTGPRARNLLIRNQEGTKPWSLREYKRGYCITGFAPALQKISLQANGTGTLRVSFKGIALSGISGEIRATLNYHSVCLHKREPINVSIHGNDTYYLETPISHGQELLLEFEVFPQLYSESELLYKTSSLYGQPELRDNIVENACKNIHSILQQLVPHTTEALQQQVACISEQLVNLRMQYTSHLKKENEANKARNTTIGLLNEQIQLLNHYALLPCLQFVSRVLKIKYLFSFGKKRRRRKERFSAIRKTISLLGSQKHRFKN